MLSIVKDIIQANQVLVRWVISGVIFAAFFMLKSLVTSLAVTLLNKALNRKRQLAEKATIEHILIPLKSLMVLTGAYLALYNLNVKGTALLRFYRISVIVVVAWVLLRFCDSVSGTFFQLNDKLDDHFNINLNKTLISFLQKMLKVLVICIAGVAILNETGTNVTTIITGIGLGGLTFALAAQDTASNLFGGLVILTDKPFAVGDWIQSPDLEGVVEDITFRSTRIRTFTDAQVVVPNSTLTSQPITNWSRMNKRRVSFSIGLTYDTPKQKLEKCLQRINLVLEQSEDVVQENIVVNFNGFKDSHLEIAVYFFTSAITFATYQKVKEKINFAILSIVEEEGAVFAFPTQTLHLNTK